MSGTDKTASSQVAWALLTEGVTRARVEAHRLKHMIVRATKLVEESSEKEHLYQVAGDIIVGLPARLEQLEVALDRSGLALSKMGVEFLEARLPLSEKNMVDEAVEPAFGGGRPMESVVAGVKLNNLQEEVYKNLGYEGDVYALAHLLKLNPSKVQQVVDQLVHLGLAEVEDDGTVQKKKATSVLRVASRWLETKHRV